MHRLDLGPHDPRHLRTWRIMQRRGLLACEREFELALLVRPLAPECDRFPPGGWTTRRGSMCGSRPWTPRSARVLCMTVAAVIDLAVLSDWPRPVALSLMCLY